MYTEEQVKKLIKRIYKHHVEEKIGEINTVIISRPECRVSLKTPDEKILYANITIGVLDDYFEFEQKQSATSKFTKALQPENWSEIR